MIHLLREVAYFAESIFAVTIGYLGESKLLRAAL